MEHVHHELLPATKELQLIFPFGKVRKDMDAETPHIHWDKKLRTVILKDCNICLFEG